MLELAYRPAVSEQPMIRRIREKLVVLINPVANPDGRDKQVEWFYRYLKGRTDQAMLPRQLHPTGRATRSSTSTAMRISRFMRPPKRSFACSMHGIRR